MSSTTYLRLNIPMSNINNRVELFEISRRFASFLRTEPLLTFLFYSVYTHFYVRLLSFSLLRRVKTQMPDKNNTLLFFHFLWNCFLFETLRWCYFCNGKISVFLRIWIFKIFKIKCIQKKRQGHWLWRLPKLYGVSFNAVRLCK